MSESPAPFRYRAFISYAHRDASAAKWLHRGIERFKIDKDLIGRDSPLGPIPKTLAPVFRDRDEFTAGHSLTGQMLEALNASAALIVICSPAAAASHYVNEEIRLFRHHHPERPVIPLIVDGKPGGAPSGKVEAGFPSEGATKPNDPNEECFPPALRFQLDADGAVTDQPHEVLAADWREAADGRELALAKIIARLLGLGTDDVYRRAERARRRANRIRAGIAASLLLLASGGGVVTWLYMESREQVISYDTALERYCRDYLERFREQCDREDLEGTFQRIASAAAEGRDPRNKQILELIAEGRSQEAAVLMRELAAEEAARGQAQIKRAAQRYRDSGRIAFLNDPITALADYERAVELDPDDPEGWNQLGALQLRTGALDAAIGSFERVLSLGNAAGRKDLEAIATGNLGLIYETRGELDRAEAMHKRALELNEALGRKEGVASQFAALGLVEQARGNLDAAEDWHRKSLELEEELGRKEGIARETGNLGLIYMTRGELDRAEAMFLKGLEIDEALGRKEGMAAKTGNLGLIYRRRGELDRAEAMYLRSLEISDANGMKELSANQNANLGALYQQRGDTTRACQHLARARDLYAEVGAPNAEEYAKALRDFGCPEE